MGSKWVQNGVNLPKFIKKEFFINFLNIKIRFQETIRMKQKLQEHFQMS